MFTLSLHKLKLFALVGATAALVACGGGGTSSTTTINGNVLGNVTAANFAALTGTTFTFPNGLPDLGTNVATTVTLGGTAAAPTATITSGGTSVVADVVFGSCRFTFRTPAFGRSAAFTFTYSLCTYQLNTNSLFASFNPQPVLSFLTLNTYNSALSNINAVTLPAGSFTVNGNPLTGGTLTPVTGATGGGS